jgi:hypothetical protein
MSASFTAATLELAATNLEIAERLEALRTALPQPPVMKYSRSEFDALSDPDKMAAVKRGAKLHDTAPPAKAKPELPDGQIRRSDFDKLGPAERHKLIRGGSMVVD